MEKFTMGAGIAVCGIALALGWTFSSMVQVDTEEAARLQIRMEAAKFDAIRGDLKNMLEKGQITKEEYVRRMDIVLGITPKEKP